MRRVRTYKELASRLDQVVGVPFSELAGLYGKRWRDLPNENKGYAGNLINFLVGADAGSAPRPDLSELGIEVKSIPIGHGARVLQPTKVGTLNRADVIRRTWWESNTFNKLRSVLFVPVVKYDPRVPGEWFIRRPFMWLPSESVMRQLQTDYESVRTLLMENPGAKLSSATPPKGQGVILHPKPNARDGSVRKTYSILGKKYELPPKAWFLRASFTGPVVADSLAVDTQTLGISLAALSKRAPEELDED